MNWLLLACLLMSTTTGSTPMLQVQPLMTLSSTDYLQTQQTIERFTTRGARELQLTFNRYDRYRDCVLAELDQRKLPRFLQYIILAESRALRLAESGAGAVGLWQLMPGTARSYGLRVDSLVDEPTPPFPCYTIWTPSSIIGHSCWLPTIAAPPAFAN